MKLELSELINFENKYKLNQRKILSINYWDFCRMNIFYEIRSEYEKTNHVVDLNHKIKIKEKKINIKLFSKYVFFNSKNIDLLFISDPRRTKQDDMYKSIFIDTISDYLKNDFQCLTLEEPNWRAWGYGMPPHFYPTNSHNLKYVDFFEYKFLLYEKLFRMINRKEVKLIKEELDYLYTIINKEFNVNISNTKKVFSSLIIYFIIMGKIYSRLIKKLNPKIVLLNYRPTYFKVLINSICRANGIPTVDLQHGVISKEDPLDRKNPNGHNLLSTSDYLFAYGEKLVDKTNLCFLDENIKYVGFPFLEQKIKKDINRPNFMNENYKYILIISQSIAGEKFAHFAATLAELLKNKKEYKIIFKYHPNEITKDFIELKKENIIEIKNLNIEIYQIQKYSYCQIGAYSTGLYEGLNFLLPTIILKNFPGSDGTIEILKYMKKGIYEIDNPEKLIKILNNLVPPEINDINLLWKKDSLKNIKNEIQNILKSQKL